MIHGWTADQVRAAEEPLLAAGRPLMAHAAFALAGAVVEQLIARQGRVRGGRVVLLVGAGNNGGDTLYAGALLARRGVRVLALCTTDRPHEEGLAALRRAGARAVRVVDAGSGPPRTGTVGTPESDRPEPGHPDDATDRPAEQLPVGAAVAEAWTADVLLDGLLGIGGRGAPRGVAGLLVGLLDDLLAEAGRPSSLPGAATRSGRGDAGRDGPLVVAVDLPSGIGVDDGSLPDGPVLRADLTVTFGGAKAGLLLPPADAHAGRLRVVDLDLPLSAQTAPVGRLSAPEVAGLWPVPGPRSHKYTRGVLGVVAGTRTYPGAAVLTVTAAARAGVGMVRYLGPDEVTEVVLRARPEVVHGAGRVQAWVLGPGVDPADADQADRVRAAISSAVDQRLPAVLDAGALDLVPDRLPGRFVLTPHAGELAALLTRRGHRTDRAAVEARPWDAARCAHEATGATVLLKGSTTVVVGEGGTCYAQADGPGWLATAGAGDVLAGLLGALLAGRSEDLTDDPALAARLAAAAALVHGRAAEVAVPGGPVTALAVADALPATVAEMLRG